MQRCRLAFLWLQCTFLLQVAALSHFEKEPLSALAAAALEGREALQQACAKLAPKVLSKASRAAKRAGVPWHACVVRM